MKKKKDNLFWTERRRKRRRKGRIMVGDNLLSPFKKFTSSSGSKTGRGENFSRVKPEEKNFNVGAG